MALDYQGRTPAQRFTEERFGTVEFSRNEDRLIRTVTGYTVGDVRRVKRSDRTGRVTGQVLISDKWHPFTQLDADSRILISPLGKRD